MRVQDSFSDRFCHELTTLEEHLREYNISLEDGEAWIADFNEDAMGVPDDLVRRHKEACKKFWEVDNELHKYLKENKLI